MGRVGRPPKPIELHIADGTYRPDRHGEPVDLAEPVPAGSFLPCPRHVEEVDGGAEAWAAIVGPIVESGILRESDRTSLGMAAVALARWRMAVAHLEEHGYEADGKFGPVPSPWLAIAERAEMSFARWSARFGLTPSDRASLGLALIAGRKAAADGWGDLDDDDEEG